MKNRMKAYLHKSQTLKKQKVNIVELEKEMIESFQGLSNYHTSGGYEAFYAAILSLEQEGLLKRQRGKIDNGRTPFLPLQWWLMPQEVSDTWSAIDMVKVSDLLDLRKFKGNPKLQTRENWKRITTVYEFVKHARKRDILSREQRSYELFGNEKFLSNQEGREFLTMLGLTLEDLKAKVYAEPFIFSLVNLKPYMDIETALIVENHSTYHTLHHFFQQHGSFRGFRPDLLIYGEGKKIESSACLFYDMFPKRAHDVYYFGDIDAEGWGIYSRLKEKKIWNSLRLAVPFYEALVYYARTEVPYQNHNENAQYLQIVQEELEEHGAAELANCIQCLWKKRSRLPQEAITLEKMKREVSQIE